MGNGVRKKRVDVTSHLRLTTNHVMQSGSKVAAFKPSGRNDVSTRNEIKHAVYCFCLCIILSSDHKYPAGIAKVARSMLRSASLDDEKDHGRQH